MDKALEATAGICGTHHDPFCRSCVAAYETNTDRILARHRTTDAAVREALLHTQHMLEGIAHSGSTNFREVRERLIANRAALATPDVGEA